MIVEVNLAMVYYILLVSYKPFLNASKKKKKDAKLSPGRDMNTQRHMHILVAALFLIAKNWKQPNVHQLVNESTKCTFIQWNTSQQ